VPDPEPPDNIGDGTRVALVCEWIDENAVDHMLRALELLTTSLPAPDLGLRVLTALRDGDQYPFDQDVYIAALGNPDANGTRAPGLANFLDILAKANNLSKPIDESDLFSCSGPTFYCTQELIDEIFDARNVDNTGPLAIAKINESFGRKDNYLALYQLLCAYVQTARDAGETNAVNYPARLQNLRAAFQINPDRLAKQVAAKIASVAM
jgi:hypothetical protein